VFALIFSFVFIACQTDRTDRDMETDRGLNGTNNTGTELGRMDDDKNDFWDEDRDFSYDQRAEYRTEVNRSMEKLDAEIARLESRAENASADTKEDINERITELKDRRDAIQNRMNTFADVQEDKWEDFKDGINDAWTDVEDSYDKIVRDLGDDEDERPM